MGASFDDVQLDGVLYDSLQYCWNLHLKRNFTCIMSTSSGIMDGIHSVDVKLLLKPLMIINLTAIADAAGLDYKNTMDDYRDKDAEAKKRRMEILAAKLQAKLAQGKKATPNDPGVEIQEDVVEELTADDMDTEETMTEEAPAPTGLMAKEV